MKTCSTKLIDKLLLSAKHGVRHGQQSGGAYTEYIVYKNYNMWQSWASSGF